MLDISVSVVTYNNSEVISNTIKSLVKYLPCKLSCEIYIIDNNSIDNTVKLIENIKDSRIKIIKLNKNLGFGKAHNIAIKKSNSKYHIVLNPDIIIKNNIIKELFDCMENNKNIGLLSPLIKYPNGDIQNLCKLNPTVLDMGIRFCSDKILKRRQAKYTMLNTGYNKEFNIPYATGCFMFFRTTTLKKIKGFDENFFMYLEDADITRRINEISETIFYPYNYIIHIWERGSHRKLKLIYINIKSLIYYFNKWGWKLF